MTPPQSAPLVTLGITAYNAAHTIERAVRSALAQDWRPIEIVIVDDASTDGTDVILARLSASEPEIKLSTNTLNLGSAGTRNRIIAEARGEFIALFDDDDISLPHRVSAQVRRLLQYEARMATPGFVICHTAREQHFGDGRRFYAATMGNDEAASAPHGTSLVRRLLLGTPLAGAYGACATCSQLARTSTYRAFGGFDAAFRRSDDTELNVRIAKAGGHFVGCSEPLVIQTMTRGSEKGVLNEADSMLQLLEKHRDVLEAEGQYAFTRQWITTKHKYLANQKTAFALDLFGLLLRHPILTARRLLAARRELAMNRSLNRFYRGSDCGSDLMR